VIRAHQPGSEPINIPETIPNPVVVPRPTPTPTEPAPKEPVRIPEKVPSARQVGSSLCLCSSNSRRKTMPAPQGLAVPQQRGADPSWLAADRNITMRTFDAGTWFPRLGPQIEAAELGKRRRR